MNYICEFLQAICYLVAIVLSFLQTRLDPKPMISSLIIYLGFSIIIIQFLYTIM